MESLLIIVFEFLSPRDLLSVASISNGLTTSLTYSHLLRSALIRDGTTYKLLLETIINLCRKGSIFIPSPIRMLRLINGNANLCENPQCVRDYFCPARLTPFGLFVCSYCEHHSVQRFNWNSEADILAWMESVGNIRFARGKSHDKTSIWLSETSKGDERIGPVLTVETMERLRDLVSLSSNTQTLADSLKSHLTTIPTASKTLLDTYDMIVRESVEYHEKLVKRRAEAQEQKSKVREEKYEIIKQTVVTMLSGEPWSECALQSAYLNSRLDTFIRAPSKGTKTVINTLVRNIRLRYKNLFEFMTLDFLFDESENEDNQSSSSSSNNSSSSSNNSDSNGSNGAITSEETNSPKLETDIPTVDSSFEGCLKAYFNEKYDLDWMMRYLEDKHWGLLSESLFHEALVEILKLSNIRTIFCDVVEKDEDKRLCRDLFTNIYLNRMDEIYHKLNTLVTATNNKMLRFDLFKSTYDEAKLEYPILLNNITEYVSLEWLEEKDRDPENKSSQNKELWNELLKREMDSMKTSFNPYYKQLMMAKNYPPLYIIHCRNATWGMLRGHSGSYVSDSDGFDSEVYD